MTDMKSAKRGDILIIYEIERDVIKVNKDGIVIRSVKGKGVHYKQTLTWDHLDGCDAVLKTKEKDPEYFL